jgi:hypothetical protein
MATIEDLTNEPHIFDLLRILVCVLVVVRILVVIVVCVFVILECNQGQNQPTTLFLVEGSYIVVVSVIVVSTRVLARRGDFGPDLVCRVQNCLD